MSKASEWASAEHEASRLSSRLSRFETELRTAPLDGCKEYTFAASVGRTNDQADMCLTDYRLGGVSMSRAQALGLARWILETFSDGA